jgi:glycosyltransferase involved in cell wall biosynthesis
MRIAFLTHEPFHPPSGGGSAEALYLARELVKRGHELHVFCPALDDPEGVSRQFGVVLHEFRGWQMGRYARWRNAKYLMFPSALNRMVRQAVAMGGNYDLLLAQHTISAVAASRLRAPLGIPVVLNFLDYLTGFMETWPRWILPTPMLRMLNRYEMSLPRRYAVDGIMTVSEPLADRFVATGFPRERVQAIQYGYDPAWFRMDPARRDPRSSPAASEGIPTVIMHGSFDQHHLGPIAREAVCRVADAKPSTRFRFLGRETEGLRRFAADVKSQSPRVLLQTTGFLPYTDVGRELAAATVGLVPYEESNGTHCAFVAKAVEYLGCGLAVASTPLENLQRYFRGDPAIRFSGFDGKSLASVILSWLDTPSAERNRIGADASARVERELSWDVVSRRAIDFVEKTVRQRQLS